ncbi:hypothetical protein MPTK1_5g18810 [Marchantia polymorpha subsp. ruderalis]|uniref:Uncharacterized protein n=2 Tax=Marchantia polymorpha TaxID=3197 RepID=A0AAF6BJV5_MARPO|nr:hypothetical protein MARPO_0073s0060 [Marchantia polymorpha]BBN12289.1 hypothetical protein Mp_5g18810 [Marchantia polymorpha subsp. ruderalis]|eukprot:PTQ35186.1 hypothetical protein MARPO_0073s0060 [Marchantia polymorpha]
MSSPRPRYYILSAFGPFSPLEFQQIFSAETPIPVLILRPPLIPSSAEKPSPWPHVHRACLRAEAAGRSKQTVDSGLWGWGLGLGLETWNLELTSSQSKEGGREASAAGSAGIGAAQAGAGTVGEGKAPKQRRGPSSASAAGTQPRLGSLLNRPRSSRWRCCTRPIMPRPSEEGGRGRPCQSLSQVSKSNMFSPIRCCR